MNGPYKAGYLDSIPANGSSLPFHVFRPTWLRNSDRDFGNGLGNLFTNYVRTNYQNFQIVGPFPTGPQPFGLTPLYPPQCGLRL